MYKVAVIGSPGSVDAYRALGVTVFNSSGALETEQLLAKIQSEFAAVFITEDVAPSNVDLLRLNLEEELPALTLLPAAIPQKAGLAKLQLSVEKAMGADILGLGGD